MPGKSFCRLRHSIFYGIAVALAAPPLLAVADAVARRSGSDTGSSWHFIVALPIILTGMAFLGAPVSVPVGIVGGTVLSWWAARTQVPRRLPRDAALLGVVLSMVVWAVMARIDSGVWGYANPASWLFPVVGGLGGWLVGRAVFPAVGRGTA